MAKVEEIRVGFVDIEAIYDYIEQFPNKTIIYDIPFDKGLEVNWDVLKVFKEKIDLVLCIHDLHLVDLCKTFDFKWFWAYPIITYHELKGIAEMGASYLYISAPLTFDLPFVAKYNIPIRVCANVAHEGYVKRKNGITGFFIRPEDISKYEEYISVIEFKTQELQQERTLHHVYAENGNWPGNLNKLITNLDFDIDNRMIEDVFADSRIRCRQRCMSGGNCHLCERQFSLISTIRHAYYEEKRKQKEENENKEDN